MDERPTKDEIVVQAVGEPDRYGRVMFFAYWSDATPPDQGGPTNGIRGQVFDASLDDFMIKQHARDKTVRFIDHEPEWEPVAHVVATEDLRNVFNLASETEDISVEEAESLDRVWLALGDRDLRSGDDLGIGY